jgi:hypothetical protein
MKVGNIQTKASDVCLHMAVGRAVLGDPKVL